MYIDYWYLVLINQESLLPIPLLINYLIRYANFLSDVRQFDIMYFQFRLIFTNLPGTYFQCVAYNSSILPDMRPAPIKVQNGSSSSAHNLVT